MRKCVAPWWLRTPAKDQSRVPRSDLPARSLHHGGVFVCMADGSVRWIDDTIEVQPSTAMSLSVWDRLIFSADGTPVQ